MLHLKILILRFFILFVVERFIDADVLWFVKFTVRHYLHTNPSVFPKNNFRFVRFLKKLYVYDLDKKDRIKCNENEHTVFIRLNAIFEKNQFLCMNGVFVHTL